MTSWLCYEFVTRIATHCCEEWLPVDKYTTRIWFSCGFFEEWKTHALPHSRTHRSLFMSCMCCCCRERREHLHTSAHILIKLGIIAKVVHEYIVDGVHRVRIPCTQVELLSALLTYKVQTITQIYIHTLVRGGGEGVNCTFNSECSYHFPLMGVSLAVRAHKYPCGKQGECVLFSRGINIIIKQPINCCVDEYYNGRRRNSCMPSMPLSKCM